MNSYSFYICGTAKHMPGIPNMSPILVCRTMGWRWRQGGEVCGGAVNDVLKINCSKGISWKPRTSSPQLCKSLASLKTFCYLLEPFAGPGMRQPNFRQANGCAYPKRESACDVETLVY
jgi:hypothetical protein